MTYVHGKYLGEEILPSYNDTPYEGFTPTDWALEYIGMFGGIDGDFHKQWVLDQVSRILNETPVILRVARWEDGFKEYRYSTAEQRSDDYLEWVKMQKGEYDEETDSFEYNWSEGSPP